MVQYQIQEIVTLILCWHSLIWVIRNFALKRVVAYWSNYIPSLTNSLVAYLNKHLLYVLQVKFDLLILSFLCLLGPGDPEIEN